MKPSSRRRDTSAISVAGHATTQVGLGRALAAKQSSIEHLDRYMEAVVADDFAAQAPPGQLIFGGFLRHIDDDKLRAASHATRDAGVANTPPPGLFNLFASDEMVASLLQLPELRYAPPALRNFWAQQRQGMLNSFQANSVTPQERAAFVAARGKIARGLYEGGGALLAGSDSPQFFLVSGFALHRELRALVAAGLSPYSALSAATRAPAEHLRVINSGGAVQVGRRADLLLLDANPVLDVSTAARPAGVMTRGRWLPASQLQSLLESVAAIHTQTSAAQATPHVEQHACQTQPRRVARTRRARYKVAAGALNLPARRGRGRPTLRRSPQLGRPRHEDSRASLPRATRRPRRAPAAGLR